MKRGRAQVVDIYAYIKTAEFTLERRSKMTPEQVDRLINLVVTIGGKAATEGFAIAMRRVTFLAITDLAWALLITILCGITLFHAQILWHKHIECKASEHHYDDMWGICSWATRVITVLMWIVLASPMVQSGFDKLINPEWHAVQMLLGLL